MRRVWVGLLVLLAGTVTASEAAPAATPAVIPGHTVPFPPNATPGAHDGFPLTGQHVLAQCAGCHAEGRYEGTASQCLDCHAAARPANHFEGICAECHTTVAWTPAELDHTGLTDCAGCHAANRPAPHFEGQCSLCHGTVAWQGAVFNHSTIVGTDCAACHAPPPNHFGGECRTCHTDTSNFRNASFNHRFPINHGDAGGTCATCHAGVGPPGYTCLNCHEPERVADKHDEVAGFGASCTACHSDGWEVDD